MIPDRELGPFDWIVVLIVAACAWADLLLWYVAYLLWWTLA